MKKSVVWFTMGAGTEGCGRGVEGHAQITNTGARVRERGKPDFYCSVTYYLPRLVSVL